MLKKADKREHARVQPDPANPISVQIVGDDFMDMVRARDISVGGLAIVVKHNFDGCDINAQVQLIVKLPGQKAFMAKGIIRHRIGGPGHFGVQFTQISAADTERVRKYVEQRVAEGGGC